MAIANYAYIKGESVVNIVIFDDPTQDLLDLFIKDLELDAIVPCGNNKNAIMGATYSNGVFIKPQPFPSWILNENSDWVPPIPNPSVFTGSPKTDKLYEWDENTVSWVKLTLFSE